MFSNDFNFNQLRSFHYVIETRSFTRAAKELSITQPAVSIQVRALETNLGSPLIIRRRKRLELTTLGNNVYHYTKLIFPLLEELRNVLEENTDLTGGHLTIGSSTTPGEYILPWVIGRFRKKYPKLDVSLSIGNTRAIVEKILNRQVDVGMAGGPVNIKGLASYPYVCDDVVIIAPRSHKLTSRQSVTLNEISQEEFVLRESGSATRKTAEDALNLLDVKLNIVMELGSNEAVKNAVSAGIGLGMISKFSLGQETADNHLKAVKVEGWSCSRQLYVFYRNDSNLSRAQREFLKYLKEESPLWTK